MRAPTLIRLFILLLFFCTGFSALGQQADKGNLFSAGHAAGFIGGLYEDWYTYKDLHKHGDFGIGAPAMLDGELIVLDGKIYKTQATGQTSLVGDAEKTPYAVVCFFKVKQSYKPAGELSKAQLFKYLDSLLTNQNGIYAIHIKGDFKYLKTRAFPPVKQKPYQPLASMLNLQHFFEFNTIKGNLVGYRLPGYMEGPHISGYHFHFLSADKTAGGHLIEVTASNIVIEVDVLDSFTLAMPNTPAFNSFDFKKDRTNEIKSVENGKKQ